MNHLYPICSFLSYYAKSITKYKVHSPFVYDFIENIFEKTTYLPPLSQIERERKNLLKDQRIFSKIDFGAGSKKGKNALRMVSEEAKHSLTPAWQCRFLFNLVQHYKPENMVELGTSLGISTLYQALGNPKARFWSIEGNHFIHTQAKRTIEKFELEIPPILLLGSFRQHLKTCLDQLGQLDYIFIDGDHQSKSLLDYYQICSSYLHQDSIMIIHDINWSKDMQDGWQRICKEEAVTLSINLYYLGILFFRKGLGQKRDYKLIHSKWKPWQLGISPM